MTMNNSFACNSFNCVKLTRRSALQIGGLGLLGLNLPRLLAAEENKTAAAPPVRAKSVIFLYQFGGPSHIDMFDMKPDAPDGIRGPYKPIAIRGAGDPGLRAAAAKWPRSWTRSRSSAA